MFDPWKVPLVLENGHPALQDLAIVPHEEDGVQDSVRETAYSAETVKYRRLVVIWNENTGHVEQPAQR